MSVTVKYVEEKFEVVMKPVPRRGILQIAPGQGQDGYGRKISTDRMVRFEDHPRLYRVYCVTFSNNASHYIVRKGETLYFKSTDLD